MEKNSLFLQTKGLCRHENLPCFCRFLCFYFKLKWKTLISVHNYSAEIVSPCLSEWSKSQSFPGLHRWTQLGDLDTPTPLVGFSTNFARSVYCLPVVGLSFLVFLFFCFLPLLCLSMTAITLKNSLEPAKTLHLISVSHLVQSSCKIYRFAYKF